MSGRSETLGTTMSDRSEISFTWRDVFIDLTEKFMAGNYDSDEVLAQIPFCFIRKERITEVPVGNYDSDEVLAQIPFCFGREEVLAKIPYESDEVLAQIPYEAISFGSAEKGNYESAIGGKATRPPPRGRRKRKLVTCFITSIIKHIIKNKKPAGTTSSERSIVKTGTTSLEYSIIKNKKPAGSTSSERSIIKVGTTSWERSIIKYKKPSGSTSSERSIIKAGTTSLDRTIIKNKKQAGSTSSEPPPTALGDFLIFPYEELKEATNSFEKKIGVGGFSSVYLGKLRDERKVAVKKLYKGISKRFEQFNNEVTVLSSLRHQNLVSLYGCTNPETDKLLIVYEFVPNGTLASHLHGQRPPLSWALRIQIATETAMALAYLHSQVPPIIHRDVTSSNILLDNDFHAKVADLGLCRRFPLDAKSVTTEPQGTQGYRDPEYEQYCNLTDKSDVYSFGVVLLELISGEQAVDVNRKMSEIYLFKMALSKIVNKELEQLVDSRLGYDSESEIGMMINSVAELACVCLNPEANERLPMAEVHTALNEIKGGL